MISSRRSALTLLLVAGFALHAKTVSAQDLPLPSKKADYEAINSYKESRGIPTAEIPAAQKQLQLFARYYADVVKHPLVYKFAQDPSTKEPMGRTIPSLDGPLGIITDLQRFILEPTPATKVSRDSADYIREMGIALDGALKPLILENPEKIVRINATRLLAIACKSGATVHYSTLIEILKNANVPVEIKHYALLAAGNLLSAYDVFDMKSRRHSNGWKQMPKGAGDKEVAELVVEIERFIVEPAIIMNGVPNFEVKNATPDQIEVIRFIRRQAIKALGQIRFVAIPGVDGNSTLYPAFTLARVCISDPTLGVLPSPSECAEAAIGLCNMSPVTNGNLRKDYSAETAIEAVTAALITFATPRASNQNDRTLPWRGYALRLSEALRQWRGLFDPLFDPVNPGKVDPTAVPKDLTALIQSSQTSVFTPMDKVGFDGKPDPITGLVSLDELRKSLNALRDRPDRKPLFADVPATVLLPNKK